MNTVMEAKLIQRALEGDQDAFRNLVRLVEDKVFNLALRFLYDREDAADATQEILIRAVTNLGSFRQDSRFSTWVYRIAVNHLLKVKKSCTEQQMVSFEVFEQDLRQGLSDDPYEGEDRERLLEEVKFSCTAGMLICLDRPHRIALILGMIFKVDSKEGGKILNISPTAFRKRTSRARRKLTHFLRDNCGLVNPANSCHCHRKLQYAMVMKRIEPDDLRYAGRDTGGSLVANAIEEMEALNELADLYDTHPVQAAPPEVSRAILALLGGDERFDIVSSWD